MLSSLEYSASQTLTDIHVRGGFDRNAPRAAQDSGGTVTYATTLGIGEGADAQIRLRPPYFDAAGDSYQVTLMLHEIGHATGRIEMGHSGAARNDPSTSDGWNASIEAACMTPALRQQCGANRAACTAVETRCCPFAHARKPS